MNRNWKLTSATAQPVRYLSFFLKHQTQYETIYLNETKSEMK